MSLCRRTCRGRYAVLFVVGVRLPEVGELAPRALAVGSDAVTERLVGRESQHHVHHVISQGATVEPGVIEGGKCADFVGQRRRTENTGDTFPVLSRVTRRVR